MMPFTRVPKWTFDHGGAHDWPEPDLLVFGVICNHLNPKNECWPSIARLCAISHRAKRTVSRSVNRLWKIGAIRVVYRGAKSSEGRSSNLYLVAMSLEHIRAYSISYYEHREARRVRSLQVAHKSGLQVAHKQEVLNKHSTTPPISILVQNVIQSIPDQPEPQITTRIERRGIE